MLTGLLVGIMLPASAITADLPAALFVTRFTFPQTTFRARSFNAPV